MLKTSNKEVLIARSEWYHQAKVYDPHSERYVGGFEIRPESVMSYQEVYREPVVATEDLYRLDSTMAWVTVNHYNAVVLNTTNMFIADIDIGDPRLSDFATVDSVESVIDSLSTLDELDARVAQVMNSSIAWANQSYRVYRTCKGCRLICTSMPMPLGVWNWGSEPFGLLRFLRSDPNYIQLCGIQKTYRARLTPKPWRVEDGECHVCDLVHIHGDDRIAPELEEQVRLHDDMVLSDRRSYDTCLA